MAVIQVDSTARGGPPAAAGCVEHAGVPQGVLAGPAEPENSLALAAYRLFNAAAAAASAAPAAAARSPADDPSPRGLGPSAAVHRRGRRGRGRRAPRRAEEVSHGGEAEAHLRPGGGGSLASVPDAGGRPLLAD